MNPLPAVATQHLVALDYDDPTAYPLALHAEAVYQDADGYERACIEGGWTDAVVVSTGATQEGLAWCPWAIVLSVRGSSELADWRENLRSARRRQAADFIPGANGTVGRGFYTQAERGWSELEWWFARALAECPEARVWHAAHSLGAPVSALLIARAVEQWGPRAFAGAYHFESPRVGDLDFARWWDARFAARSWSVVHTHRGEVDVVTRLPPRWTGARHHCRGRLVVLEEDRAFVGADADDRLARRPPQAWRLVTRTIRGGRAHPVRALLGTLLARMDRERAVA